MLQPSLLASHVHRDAPAPDFAGRRFSRWARKHSSPKTGRKVVYFHGCGTEYYEPQEGEKVVAILEHNGFEVEVPKRAQYLRVIHLELNRIMSHLVWLGTYYGTSFNDAGKGFMNKVAWICHGASEILDGTIVLEGFCTTTDADGGTGKYSGIT